MHQNKLLGQCIDVNKLVEECIKFFFCAVFS